MKKIQALISDQDGTLVASEELWPAIDQVFFTGLIGDSAWPGWNAKWLEMRKQSVQMDKMLAIFIEDHQLDQNVPALKEARENAMFDSYRTHLRATPGAGELLSHCQKTGLPVAVASGMSARIIRTVIEIMDWTSFVQIVASTHEVKNNKPDPAVYLLAAERLGVSPTDCWATENEIKGYQSAVSAGMHAFAIPHTGEQAEQFRAVGIEMTASLHDVMRCLM